MAYKTPQATTTVSGVQRNATDAEAVASALTTVSITPSNLPSVFASPSPIGSTAPNTAIATQLDINIGAAGDPKVIFDINNVDKFYIGVDDSDSDILKIGTGSAVGTTEILRVVSGQGVFVRDESGNGLAIRSGTQTKNVLKNSGTETYDFDLTGVLAQYIIIANGDDAVNWYWYGTVLTNDNGTTQNILTLSSSRMTITLDADDKVVVTNTNITTDMDITVSLIKLR